MTRFIQATILSCFLLALSTEANAFGPCQQTIPEGISFVPRIAACGGKAGIIAYKEFREAFSIVVRDCNNNDRDPCHPGEDSCGTNYSSPFKAIQFVGARVKRLGKEYDAKIHCFREIGQSEVFKLVRRMTIKMKNPVQSDKDIVKLCLKTRTKTVHPLSIVKLGGTKAAGLNGKNAACKTQEYLSCSLKYEDICPKF